MFFGYKDEHKGFVCYDPKEQHVCTSKNAIFLEHIPFYSLCALILLDKCHIFLNFLSLHLNHPLQRSIRPRTLPPVTPVPDRLSLPSPPLGNGPPNPPPLRRSSLISTPLDIFGFPVLFTPLDYALIPTSYSQASEVLCWQNAMTKELLALKENSTWDTLSKSNMMRAWIDTRLSWLPKAFHNNMESIVKRHLH